MPGRAKQRRTPVLGALGILAIVSLLAGCGGSSHDQPHTTTTHVSTRGSTGTVVHSIATVDDFAAQSDQPDHLRVSIYDLRRSGPFVVLDYGISCVQASSGCSLEFDFAADAHSQQRERVYAQDGFGTARLAWRPEGSRLSHVLRR